MATIAEVAKKSGVSPTTASFVLNGLSEEKKISAACASRVRDCADKLGYRGNYHARTLMRGKAMTIGFMSVIFSEPTRDLIANAVVESARQNGYETLEVMPGEGEQMLSRGIEYLQERRIDGLIVYKKDADLALPVLEKLPQPLPIVYVWYYPKAPYPIVSLDPAPGIEECAKHLATLGHRSVLWLGIRRNGEIQVPERLEAFRQAAEDMAIQEHYVEPGRGGLVRINAFHNALQADPPALDGVTAVMCYNDEMALALNLLLREKGLRVPDDLSVVGFDDLMGDHFVPPLTTISHAFREMGRKAVETVLRMAGNEESCRDFQSKEILAPSKLVVRDSTSAPKA